MGDRGLGDEEDAAEVDVEHLVPLVLGHVDHVLGTGDAGDVGDHVEPTQCLSGTVDGVRGRLPVLIGRRRPLAVNDPPPPSATSCRPSRRARQRSHRNRPTDGTLGGEAQRGGAADAGTGSGERRPCLPSNRVMCFSYLVSARWADTRCFAERNRRNSMTNDTAPYKS